MRCECCNGTGGYFNGLLGESRPCPDCMGSGVMSCCDGRVQREPTEHAVASYVDPSYPERKCDYCEKLYRGPAVYCSLECATDDL